MVTTSTGAPGRRSPRIGVPDALAHRLAEHPRHPARGGARGHPAGLGDDHAPPGLGEGERHERGLAGAGRRGQHRAPPGVERGDQTGQRLGHRQIG